MLYVQILLFHPVPAIYDIEVAFENPETANLKTLISGGRIKTHLYLRYTLMNFSNKYLNGN